MAKGKRGPVPEIPEETPAIIEEPGKGYPDKEPAKESTLLNLKVTDGKIDFSSTRPATMEKIQEVLRTSLADPDFRKKAGLETVSSGAPFLPPEIVGKAFDLIAFFESGIYADRLKISREQTAPICNLTVIEHSLLDPMATSIADKYIPDSWKQRMDLYTFLAMFAAIQIQKYGACVELAREIHRDRKAAESSVREPKFEEPPQA